MHRMTAGLLVVPMLAGCGGPGAGNATAVANDIAAASSPAAPSTVALTRTDVEAFVTRQARRLATSSNGAQNDVDVSFEAVEIAAGRAPTAQEAQVEGLTGGTAWPVRVDYTEHRRWKNGDTQTVRTRYRYTFYRDSFGRWDALMVGPEA
ncbi:hypothetical protein [uncultured Sphingomonas sp.]|uniref:hypothetical protein n=1 Tax=uncultured Sphingomonas sp. TaxID=158754 RepID=UPI0035CC9464